MAFNLQSAIDDLFKPPSRLQSLVDRAVGPQRDEPDLALNLDICDLVNRKKGNYPHDAVFALLPYINGRAPAQAQLALTLLDNLVKNCGHPVHYQIGSREFLNELFRRFPEYQPSLTNAVHYRVLEMLQEWRVSLCQRSRYREDLQRINDMYALLCRKGWRFPRIDSDNVAVVLEPEDTLKTKDELEKEDMDAMQAKLQELLRRATPRDLREANKLMKVITGYEQSTKQRDYNKEWEDELQALEHKSTVLHEMLREADPGRAIDDTVQELLNKCTSSLTRLRRLIAEHEAGEGADERGDLDRMVRLSDMIGEAVEAAKELRCGRKPQLRALGTNGTGAEPQAAADVNELISWDDDTDSAPNPAPNPDTVATPVSPLDDLAGLSFHTLQPLTPNSSTVPLQSPPAQVQPMTNPSLPADSQQARMHRAAATVKQNDAFDFSDLLAAAKSASANPNAARTASWGSSPDSAKSNPNKSLIDFMS
ncbi:ARF-binding protein [Coemansia sp. RSA 1822]|nr:ARF-binding protein [Coemansia sp. RSA 638]KAJ2122797.1 ARF-binding protein [Coemansia sp. RSA 720]KAJ2543850.1 ARF-binding protein [Coemansia sp. RSA 1853]KAJ2564732.1 ARF-binding protein [Coemansia sp. RSA 1822]